MIRGVRFSDAEWTVMNAVWDGAPVTARDVLDAVGDETAWAYTTVKTMLDRLADKGALEARRSDGATRYRPAVSRDEARRSATRSLAEKAFGGALGPMVHFLLGDRRLTKRERRELERLLKEDARVGRRKGKQR